MTVANLAWLRVPEIIEMILSRASAITLTGPGPSADHLQLIIRAGTRAPDHGKLEPWRFMIFEGDGRNRLGDAMARALALAKPDAEPIELEREANKALRAPTIVSVGVQIAEGKIPAIEQQLAAAAAAQNMILVAHALGYGTMWKTGAAAYDDGIKAFVGLEPSDAIVGFLYFGTAAAMPKAVRGTALESRVTRG